MLGVTSSILGRTWVGPNDLTLRHAEAIYQTNQLPIPLCNILARQGVESADVPAYLAPSIKAMLPDPRSMRDSDVAAARIVNAITSKQTVAIFADYDVDGASSGTLLYDYFSFFGVIPTLYVPDRIDEGYGPNAPAMQTLAADHDLIICVDCGTLSHDAYVSIQNCDILVIDHHLGGETLPDVMAVVNPNRQDETGDLGHLCAAAVVFLVLVNVTRILRENGTKGPDLLSMLDIVALATVADVAPLTGVNRAFVKQGLKVMAQRKRLGLNALSDVAKLDTSPTSYHLGFLLGPRINAGGRIGAADLGLRLLTERRETDAMQMAQRLDALNTERRGIEAAVREEAMSQIEARGSVSGLAWASGDGWHPGVVGIVASRVKEKTNLPSVVIGFDGDVGKGSGRSVAGIDLGASIQKLAAEGLIEKGGGHKMAAGLSLSRAQLDPAMARLDELLSAQGAGTTGLGDLRIDAVLSVAGATVDLIETMESAGPYGASAPAPRFAIADATVKFAKRVGENHLKVTLSDGAGHTLDGICFSAFDGPLGDAFQDGIGEKFHIAGRLEANTWGGKTRPQVTIMDAAKA